MSTAAGAPRFSLADLRASRFSLVILDPRGAELVLSYYCSQPYTLWTKELALGFLWYFLPGIQSSFHIITKEAQNLKSCLERRLFKRCVLHIQIF